jgi:SAM-dependent methyltransferase
MDWGLGRYEEVARQLEPAATAAVERLDLRPGEYVADVGCGTGNASLLAARRRATVVGVDPSPRLLDVARSAARVAALDVEFRIGTAASLPIADEALDAVVSVFGVIFAPDPRAAAAEMARALRPGGQIVLTAWLPGGALGELAALRSQAVAAAVGTAAPTARFAWHDRDALDGLFGPFDFRVAIDHDALAFCASGPCVLAADEFDASPPWVAARAALEHAGTWPSVRNEVERILAGANEDADAFRLTSRYTVASLTRTAGASATA